ncbi:hypothetical protein BH09BAC1_BH09BAC1_14650 [soil metagenome]
MANAETYKLLQDKATNAVELLYNRYGRKLYSYGITKWNLNEDESWDLVYQTLYKVVDTAGRYTFESEQKFGSFIFKMFINYLRNHYRDNKKVKENFEQVSFNETEYDDYDTPGGVGREVKERLADASMREAEREGEPEPESQGMTLLKDELEKMEDWQRMLLLMRSQNIPYEEISRHVGKPETQLKVYYQRLKERLMKRLGDKLQYVTKN